MNPIDRRRLTLLLGSFALLLILLLLAFILLGREDTSSTVPRSTPRGQEAPPSLTFALVYPDMAQLLPHLIDSNGQLLPGASLPPGYALVPGEPDDNPQTRATQFIGFSEPLGREVAWHLVAEEPVISMDQLLTIDVSMEGPNSDQPTITLTLSDEGTERFHQVTANNVGRRLATILNGRVVSAPTIREAIPYGRAQLSGGFTLEEAETLAAVLSTADEESRERVPE